MDWGSNPGPAIFQLCYLLRKARPELLSKVRYVYTIHFHRKIHNQLRRKGSFVFKYSPGWHHTAYVAEDGLEHGWILLLPPPL